MSDKNITKGIVISQSTAQKLKTTATNENRSESGVVREALKQYLKNK